MNKRNGRGDSPAVSGLSRVYCLGLKHPFFVPVFRKLQKQIEQYRDHAEDHDGSDDHGHFKGLASVDDQIAPALRREILR